MSSKNMKVKIPSVRRDFCSVSFPLNEEKLDRVTKTSKDVKSRGQEAQPESPPGEVPSSSSVESTGSQIIQPKSASTRGTRFG